MAEESYVHMFLHSMFYILCFKNNVKKVLLNRLGYFVQP